MPMGNLLAMARVMAAKISRVAGTPKNQNSTASEDDEQPEELEGGLEMVSEIKSGTFDTSSLSSVDIPSTFCKEAALQAVHQVGESFNATLASFIGEEDRSRHWIFPGTTYPAATARKFKRFGSEEEHNHRL